LQTLFTFRIVKKINAFFVSQFYPFISHHNELKQINMEGVSVGFAGKKIGLGINTFEQENYT
jgi:hypothetical protein